MSDSVVVSPSLKLLPDTLPRFVTQILLLGLIIRVILFNTYSASELLLAPATDIRKQRRMAIIMSIFESAAGPRQDIVYVLYFNSIKTIDEIVFPYGL